MTDETTGGRWSEALQRLFDAKHYSSRRLLAALKLPESDELLKVASSKEPAITRGQRVKALTAGLYVDADRTVDLLARILADESDDPCVRQVAASLLGRTPLKTAEEALIANVSTGDASVRQEVAAALGRVGGPRALDALDEAARTTSTSLRKQARFSQAVIAYRLGLERDPLPPVEPSSRPEEEEESVEIRLRGIGAESISDCLETLEDSTYGLEVARDRGFRITAGRAEWVLLISGQVVDRGVAPALMERRNLTALMARRGPEGDTFAIQYLVLSRPVAENVAELMVYRTDGELFYSGRAAVRDGEMEFTMTNAERPGAAPTYVTGTLGPGGVALTQAVAGPRRREKRRATALGLRSP